VTARRSVVRSARTAVLNWARLVMVAWGAMREAKGRASAMPARLAKDAIPAAIIIDFIDRLL
jgi:hypothetical protein